MNFFLEGEISTLIVKGIFIGEVLSDSEKLSALSPEGDFHFS